MDNVSNKQVIKECQQLITQAKKKTVLILAFLLFGSALITSLSLVLSLYISAFVIVMYVFAGITALFALITILTHFFYITRKPLFEFLYPKIVEDLHYHEGTAITYLPFPKEKDFGRDALLFSNFSTREMYAQLAFETQTGFMITMHDINVYTQTNNSRIVYLDGWFVQMKLESAPNFQFRIKGSPQKKSQWQRHENSGEIKIYTDVNTSASLDTKYINAFCMLREKTNAKTLMMSCQQNTLYIGIDLRKRYRYISSVDAKLYQDIRQALLQTIMAINATTEVLSAS